MLKILCNPQGQTVHKAKRPNNKEHADDKSHVLDNNARTRLRQNSQKITSAFIDYPERGLRGDVNSDFYEFLTMGIVPYIAGSATFMFVFNAANKHLNLFEKEKASVYGKKMALGVILYGLLKNISKNLVTKPVKHSTGVDTELPYENISYTLPTEAGANANIDIKYQQRKVYDSKEFFRKDLLPKEYFDKVAKKLGLGDNLNDSVSEVTPIIQNIISTTNTAKSLVSYSWAAVGVGLAVQDSWKDLFNTISNRTKFMPDKNAGFAKNSLNRIKNICNNTISITSSAIHSLFKSVAQMWRGKEGSSGFAKHAGKSLICLSALLTFILTKNVIIRAKNKAKNNNKVTIKKTKESTVI